MVSEIGVVWQAVLNCITKREFSSGRGVGPLVHKLRRGAPLKGQERPATKKSLQ